MNLALNAIEAAGSGGEVSLAAASDGDDVAIEVADTGPGPPPELADTLCEAFVTSKPEGVGLGLALAHQVAIEHGEPSTDALTAAMMRRDKVPPGED